MPASEARVLIVEDDQALRTILFTVLRHQPLGVDTATSAEEAMEKVSRCDYAVILLDVNLPDADDFLQRFREFRPESTSFILAVRDPRFDMKIDLNLVNAVVNKPLEIDLLADVVRECAEVVPPPDDPLNCPPAENDAHKRMDRGELLPN